MSLCHQVGADYIVDQDERAWLLEVNAGPVMKEENLDMARGIVDVRGRREGSDAISAAHPACFTPLFPDKINTALHLHLLHHKGTK